jgi:FtsP/CotA-like multicopper oxidase with cupredoxin domain
MPDPGAYSRGWLRRIGASRLSASRSATSRLITSRLVKRLPVGVCFLVAGVIGLGADSLVAVPGANGLAQAPQPPREFCERPASGSAVPEPRDLWSHDGVLQVDLAIHNSRQPDGSTRYCYLTPDGALSPTLRVKPGDLLILRFKNDLTDLAAARPGADQPQALPFPAPLCVSKNISDPCGSGAMRPTSANLHFHGLTAPPVCHQDDVLKTSIQPEDPPFEYRLRIPADEPPGVYWYHPHIHGYSKMQVLGGASGALIIEGIERADPELAGLHERLLVIRDQDLLNPDAPPSKSEPVVPKNQIDNDGDAANNGTGFGKPAKDLSVNFVTVPYPDYPPASLKMKPGERQLWRVLNASAITYLNLAVLFRHAPQSLGVVAIDGVPIHFNGSPAPSVEWVNHIGVPPGARVELIVEAPPLGVPALLVTRAVDTGPAGENDPNRALISITAAADAVEPQAMLPSDPEPLPPAARPWIGNAAPVRVRKLYFSERPENPNDPNSPTTFYITLDGQTPKPFDPQSDVPDIVARQGDVEDWIIENRTTELHDFHIHQLHFQLREWSGVAVNEPFVRDTVSIPYYNGRALQYPSVRLRMDFRDPNIVGTFVYHCHLLEHEDGGMMGRIRVEPADTAVSTLSSRQFTRGEQYEQK